MAEVGDYSWALTMAQAMDDGWGLYGVLVVILLYFWLQVRGASLDDLLERQHDEHVKVHKVLKDHPKGGAWSDVKRWMRGQD